MMLKKLMQMVLSLMMTVTVVGCASARINQELQRGRLNFEGGFYKDAFHQLLPLASEGNKEAEYAVGYMYYNGYGVNQDLESGMFWIKKSAALGYEPAIKALGQLEAR
jgi:TPR repeat protein